MWGRLILALSVLAFIAFAASVDGALVLAQLERAGPGAAIILGPPLAIFAMQVLGWAAILRHLGQRPSLAKLASISLGTQAQRMALPAGIALADPTQVWGLHRWCGVALDDALSSVTTKRVLTWLTNGVVCLAALAAWQLAPNAQDLGAGLPTSLTLVGATFALLASSLAVLVTMRTKRLLASVQRAFSSLPIAVVRTWFEATRRGWEQAAERMAKAVHGPRALGLPSVWFLASWLVEVAETWLLLRLLGRPMAWLDCLVIETIAALLKSLAFASPGGLGAQDLGYAVMLRAYDVPGAAELALSFVVLKRAKEAVWTALGFAAMLAWPFRRRRLEDEPSELRTPRGSRSGTRG